MCSPHSCLCKVITHHGMAQGRDVTVIELFTNKDLTLSIHSSKPVARYLLIEGCIHPELTCYMENSQKVSAKKLVCMIRSPSKLGPAIQGL